MLPELGLGENLPRLVKKTYQQALSLSKVTFTPSAEVTTIRTSRGIPFQLRFCPSLAKKPHAKHHGDASKEKKHFNPFEDPDPDMIIAQIPPANPTHTLILNKFPIIAEHFMVITKSMKEQTHKLEEVDLAVVYACLNEWRGYTDDGVEKRLFAFFNSGIHSGASQPHRHVQFLPVEAMKQGSACQDWSLLIDRERAKTGLPALCVRSTITENPSSDQLHNMYIQLHKEAQQAVEAHIQTNPQGKLQLHDTSTGSSSFSYNLGMTIDTMAIIPRKSDGLRLTDQSGSELGFACLNGTVLGASLMVKKTEEFDHLKSQLDVMDLILREIGIPSMSESASDHSRI